jgi:hypothetical protein
MRFIAVGRCELHQRAVSKFFICCGLYSDSVAPQRSALRGSLTCPRGTPLYEIEGAAPWVNPLGASPVEGAAAARLKEVPGAVAERPTPCACDPTFTNTPTGCGSPRRQRLLAVLRIRAWPHQRRIVRCGDRVDRCPTGIATRRSS